METILLLVRLLIAISVAMYAGKLIAKLKLPGILGFLLTGMILGPYALNIMSEDLTNTSWYHMIAQLLEVSIGVMFAKELIFKKMKTYGKQVITITFFQSIGTFIIVTLFFGILFLITGVPLYVALIFGGIALATAPAPALSIVNEYKTKGELTKALIPIAMIDDVIALAIFFTINAFIASMGAAETVSPLMMVGISIALPIAIGIAIAFISKPLYKKCATPKAYLLTTLGVIVLTYLIGYGVDNFLLPTPAINYMMLGMAVFTTIANILPEEVIHAISRAVGPLVSIGFIVMILNLSAPLDFRLIFGAGTLTFMYIVSRGLGKYFGTFLGAKVSGASKNVQKYLGLTLLPHSGVSLVFTGMAVASLSTFDTESATLIQGTIAAAAVINEILAVILARKGFEKAGELGDEETVGSVVTEQSM